METDQQKTRFQAGGPQHYRLRAVDTLGGCGLAKSISDVVDGVAPELQRRRFYMRYDEDGGPPSGG